jgi:hypothetical protein
LKVAVCDDAICTSATKNQVDLANATLETSMVLNGLGNPVVVYYHDGALKVAVCDDATCTSATKNTVVTTGSVGTQYSLVLDGSGNPVIAYYDVSGPQNLAVAICDDPTCTSPSLITLDSTGVVGGHPSIALDVAGNPVIAYLDFTYQTLKLAGMILG